MRFTEKAISECKDGLKEQYGFVADPELPLWENVEKQIGKMDMAELLARPRNTACHNLLESNTMPPGVPQLLGLGMNYCIKSLSTRETTIHTFRRLAEDVRRMWALRGVHDDEGAYNPSLYIKSDYKFKLAPKHVEDGLRNFRAGIKRKQDELRNRRRKKPALNVPTRSWHLMQTLKKHNTYIVVSGDKNLGPCILERTNYIQKGCSEHLGNDRNYQKISRMRAQTMQRGLQYRFNFWLCKYRPRTEEEDDVDYVCISKAEWIYLKRALKQYPDKLAFFRMTCKIHKTPWKTRPIVCCSGTFMNCWSKWLDFWLQKLKPFIPTYMKNGDQALDDFDQLTLPSNALLFVTDATAMYNNICTTHAIEVITWWLRDLEERKLLPAGFPLDAVLSAMCIIMRNNIFEFGDLCFLQLVGTAMGTSAAVMWATLYYAYHEVHCLIPRHGHNLLYFKRFIDDIFGIWTGNLTTDWTEFSKDVDNFGVLRWDVGDITPSESVDFLDMTLTIENNKIVSKTYQKAMNLHLYIPPMSAHPRGCIKGTIFSLVLRYFRQNTYRKDFIYYVGLLYFRTLERGWDRELMRELILEATERAENNTNNTKQSATTKVLKDTLFLHFQFHPDDLSRQHIRSEFEEHLGKICKDELGITRTVVAYSRPKNIGDYVSIAKLHQAPGRTASTIMGEYKFGLNPS
jgi:hypothetical protein